MVWKVCRPRRTQVEELLSITSGEGSQKQRTRGTVRKRIGELEEGYEPTKQTEEHRLKEPM